VDEIGPDLPLHEDEEGGIEFRSVARFDGPTSAGFGSFNTTRAAATLDAFEVSSEVLDRYIGVYTIAGTPAKMTVTRDGATLYIQAGAEPAGVPLEATAEDKFKIDPGVVFEFDAANGRLTIKRANGERVFTKQK
jgi:hypothetical protein